MNKPIRISIVVFGVILFAVAVALYGKNQESYVSELGRNKEEVHTKFDSEEYYKQYGADNVALLEEKLTTSYDIEVLDNFFKNCQCNVNVGFEGRTETLYFDDVNKKFPVEVIRSNGYSVYKVNQGGYFYVFWEECYDAETYEPLAPGVYFTTYIASNLNKDTFKNLKIGISTAQDVKEIDPYLELNLLLSNGIYSFSFLNENEIMRIKYADSQNLNEYNDLVVESINLVSRENMSSVLSTILPMDIPKCNLND